MKIRLRKREITNLHTLRLLGASLLFVAVSPACSKNSSAPGATGDGGSSASSTKAEELYHCIDREKSTCQETSESRRAALKTKLENGSDDDKKMAVFATLDMFKSGCVGTKREYGQGACPTDQRVGACVKEGERRYYYAGGKDGYTAETFGYECFPDSETWESADGKPLAKLAPLRMSCNRPDEGVCRERLYDGKRSAWGFCDAGLNGFQTAGDFAMKPCPTENVTGSCKEKDWNSDGGGSKRTGVEYTYTAKAATKRKSLCKMASDEWKDQ